MQLDEQIELAFKSGVEYCAEFSLNFEDFPHTGDVEEAFIDYKNGNPQSSKGRIVLDKGFS